MNLKRILCFFGIHDWIKIKLEPGKYKCKRCFKQKLVILAIMESDLREMLASGKISVGGYFSAIKKGYVEKSDLEMKDDFEIEKA